MRVKVSVFKALVNIEKPTESS